MAPESKDVQIFPLETTAVSLLPSDDVMPKYELKYFKHFSGQSYIPEIF